MKYHLIALFTVGTWGLTFVSTKVLLNNFTPLWILLIRFAIGFLALCALRPHILKIKQPKHELLFITAGATGIAAYYLFENIALVFTTATAVGVIVAVSPLFTALLSRFFEKSSSINARFFFGFIVAMIGLILVSFGGDDFVSPTLDGDELLGDILALLAALVWAIYSLLVRKISELGYETIASTKRTFLWGLIFIFPATLFFGETIPSIDAIFVPENIFNLLFLGVIASAACFATWGMAVKNLGATTSTTYIYLVPAITAISSTLILGEMLTPAIITGLVMTIAGLLLSQERNNQPKQTKCNHGDLPSD